MKEPENSDILSLDKSGLREFYYYHLARYHFAARFVRGKKVLDVGCAYGQGSALLLRSGAKKVVGIDLSAKAIRHCRKVYGSSDLSFSKQDVLRCRFPDHCFDLICAFDIIEHLPQPELFIREMSRMLKTKGTLLLVTPNREFFRLRSSRPLWPYHVREFSRRELKSLLVTKFKRVRFVGQQATKGRYAIGVRRSFWAGLNHFLMEIYVLLPLFWRKILAQAAIRLHRVKNVTFSHPYPLKIKNVRFLYPAEKVKSSRTIFAICKK